MTITNPSQPNKHRAGFTLIEMLVVVAIVLVLMCVSFISIGVIRRDLRQKELDSKAAIVYTAAQLRISQLRTAGFESRYQYQSGTNGVQMLGYLPCDAADGENETSGTLCYVTFRDKADETNASSAILPQNAVSEEVWEKQWIIEYEPLSGTVYAVFYSETNAFPNDPKALDSYRIYDYRLENGARIGYYGGGDEIPDPAEPDAPDDDTISADNGEELIFHFKVPKHNCGHKMHFSFDLSATDSDGNKYTLDLNDNRFQFDSDSVYKDFGEKEAGLADYDPDYFVFQWTLDSLRKDSLHFYQQTYWQLPLGTQITLVLTVTCDCGEMEALTYTYTSNSLFADAPEGTPSDTVYITCGRHLQNLGEASNLQQHGTVIRHAIQSADIYLGEGSAWQQVYGNKTFTPIANADLETYEVITEIDGSPVRPSINGLYLKGDGAGLFGFVGAGQNRTSLTIKGVTLKDTRIEGGGNAGCLVAQSNIPLTIDNCRVIVTESVSAVDKAEDVLPFLSAGTVGGLVGICGDVTITNSFVATTIRGTTAAGGLIGSSGGTVSVSNVYTACYLNAPKTAGLIPSVSGGTVTARNFYAVGYQVATSAASASVTLENCTPTLSNGYTAFDYALAASAQCHTATGTNVFDFSGYGGAGMDTAQIATALGDAFYAPTGETSANPYNLLGQKLTGEYPYPKLKTLSHYGDWYAPQELGKVGVFYWEYEQGSTHSGYHFAFTYTDSDGTVHRESDLCTEHDDGGYITSYGYGYFRERDIPLIFHASENWNLGTIRYYVDENEQDKDDFDTAFSALMPGCYATAYQTGENDTYLTTKHWEYDEDHPNALWTLTCGSSGGVAFSYEICPFFADSARLAWTNLQTVDTSAEYAPGSAQNPYKIRSVTQLQFINWDGLGKTAQHTLSANDQYRSNWKNFYYLNRFHPNDSGTYASDHLCWVQTHDLDAYRELGETYAFTPIGSAFETYCENGTSNPLSVCFGGSYDGCSYTIRNIRIRSDAQCIGLFGVTSGAELRNIILYTDRDCQIVNEASSQSWYAMGTLVGLAGTNGNERSIIENCMASGYRLVDSFNYANGWIGNHAGGNVGGLVGASTVPIRNCTAVNDITLSIGTHGANSNVRVGGIAGVSRGGIENCYAGGSIVSPEKATPIDSANLSYGTSIWTGGIVGGITLFDRGLFKQIMTGDTSSEPYVYPKLLVKNCYSYVTLPAKSEQTWIMGSHSIVSNGEMQVSSNLTENSVVCAENCYALESSVQNAACYRAYLALSSDPDWNGWDMSGSNSILLKNTRSPYLTYEEMSDGTLLALLNGSNSKPFAHISDEGTATYPFPAVVTDADGKPLHYGAWPDTRLSASLQQLSLDFFAGSGVVGYRETSAIRADQTIKLYTPYRGELSFTYHSGTAELTDPQTFPVAATVLGYRDGCYEVQIAAKQAGSGTLRAHLSVNGREETLDIALSVTAKLNLCLIQGSLGLYGGASEELIFAVTDINGNPVDPSALDTVLTFDISTDNATVNAPDPDVLRYDEDSGCFFLPMHTFATGEYSVSFTLRYCYPSADGTLSAQSSVTLSLSSTENETEPTTPETEPSEDTQLPEQ